MQWTARIPKSVPTYVAVILFMLGMIGGIVIGLSGGSRPTAGKLIAEPVTKKATQRIVDTRESRAEKLMASGTSKDWVAASEDRKALVGIIYAARYTPIEEEVGSFARAKTIIDYLNDMAAQELARKENSPIREHLAFYGALHEGIKKETAESKR